MEKEEQWPATVRLNKYEGFKSGWRKIGSFIFLIKDYRPIVGFREKIC